MPANPPDMFESRVCFAGITLDVDPIHRQRVEESDNVMAIFHEEQPVMWEFAKALIAKTIATVVGSIDFLDVGTGSGVWAILVAKHTDAKSILALDKSARAIAFAQENSKQNDVHVSLREEFYNMSSAPFRSVKVIGIYAPYHLYPKEIERDIPQHARGGVDGQQIFREQLCVADYHLADGGVIVFNQMCLGKNGRPQFVEYIPQLIHGASLAYINILPPTETKTFLRGVYGDAFLEWQEAVAQEYPELYFCDGSITRDGKGSVEHIDHTIDLCGRTWTDRIELHRQIALHAK